MNSTKFVRTNAIRMAWIIFASASIASAPNAAQADEVAHKVVRFKDLNLSSTEGAAVLYERIKRAAQEVCGTWDNYDPSRLHLMQTCINDAVSRAVAQVDRPMLTSLYNAKTGKNDKKVTNLAQAR